MKSSDRIGILLFLHTRKELSRKEEKELLVWRKKSPENEQQYRDMGDPEYVRRMMAELYGARDRGFEKMKTRFSYLSEASLYDADESEDEEEMLKSPEKDIQESGLSKAEFWALMLEESSLKEEETPGENGELNDSLEPVETPSLKAKKPRRYIRIFWAAAAVLLIAALGIYKTLNDSGPVRFQASIVSSAGLKGMLDDFHRGYLAGKAGITFKETAKGEPIYVFSDEPKAAKDKNYTLETKTGNEFILRLPDGTLVWMNANSSINFPANFSQDTINLKVTGALYFEASPNSTKHFIITTIHDPRSTIHEIQLRPSAARFNLSAYPDDSIIHANMMSGTARVQSDAESAEHFIQIQPGQQAAFRTGKILVNPVADTAEIMALKNGEFYFKEACIQTIMATVKRWYGVDVHYEGQILDKKYSLRVPLGADLSAITDSLKKQGLHITRQGKTITIWK